MPWKEQQLMSVRLEFVSHAMLEGANISQLCQEYGISRKTAYKWIKRFEADGLQGLDDRSRRPSASPGQISGAIIEDILALRRKHPAWGALKIKHRLLRLNPKREDVPALSTIGQILKRNGMIEPQKSVKHRAFQRFEHAEPNQLWQMDFKGDFLLGNRRRCYPLGVSDDHSRFLLGLSACTNMQSQTVKAELTKIFRQYGLPERMLMDNGAPWGQDADHRHTVLTAWLMHLGIAISHGRPYHPQTQGKQERIHRTMDEELLSRTTLANHRRAQAAFDQWRDVYNTERPHQALQMQVPADRYRHSQRAFPEMLPPIEYPSTMLVRRVQQKGRISVNGRCVKVGRPFVGYPVGLLPGQVDGVWIVHFCQSVITQIDLR